ncbi:hypothetical protein B5M09_003566 [Aphanomyces astaci]|uniref:WW domain-containing protein n=1 Tax=Aphanomyces astaci TaxID=112090 RepID=A0A3R7WLC2_APHAT|nr:hypothetical protein B5M09_003566 [Aphanomyces astaci]
MTDTNGESVGSDRLLTCVHAISHDTTLNKARHTTLVKSQSFHLPEDSLHLSASKPSNDLIWIQQFDPRTRTFYYINATTGDCTTVKPRFVSKAKARDPSHAAALVIQCAARVRRARLIVKSLRDAPAFHAVNEHATATTDASAIMHEAYVRKCRHVNVLLDDLSLAISHRHVIASHHDDAQMVASLAALHAEFKDTWTYIKSTFDATKQVVEDPAALLHLHSEDLNTTLVQVRKACLQLHRTIASHDESFMALDLFRVNQARLQFSKWSVPAAHDDGALHKAHLRVEGQLRKTMGAAGFQSLTGGMAVPPSRSFTEWHGSVVAMLASVAAYEALLEIDASSPSTSGNNTKDTLNIENIGSTQGTLCEAAAVLPSQLQSTSAGDSRVLPKQARRTKMSLDISELRQCWIDGVKLREADLAAAAQAEKDAIHMRAVERQAIQSAQEKFRNDQHKRKLTIWEAVIEGELIP